MCTLSINVKYTDLFSLNNCSYDPVKYSIYVELKPKKLIVLDGNYEISGKVLILPIVGKGKCKISLGSNNTIHYYIY